MCRTDDNVSITFTVYNLTNARELQTVTRAMAGDGEPSEQGSVQCLGLLQGSAAEQLSSQRQLLDRLCCPRGRRAEVARHGGPPVRFLALLRRLGALLIHRVLRRCSS